MIEFFNRLRDESGQTMAEYAVVLGVITFAVVVTLGLLSTAIQSTHNNVSATLYGRGRGGRREGNLVPAAAFNQAHQPGSGKPPGNVPSACTVRPTPRIVITAALNVGAAWTILPLDGTRSTNRRA